MDLFRSGTILCLLTIAAASVSAQSGFVRSGGQSIPGATITATQGTKSVSTVTDVDGHYGFMLLGPGTWSVTVEMFGFTPVRKDIDFGNNGALTNFELELQKSDLEERLQRFSPGGGKGATPPLPRGSAAQRAVAGQTPSRAGSESLNRELTAALGSENGGFVPAPATDSNDAFVVSGSLSPGMAQGQTADSGPDMRFQAGLGGRDITGQNGGGPMPGFAGGGSFDGPGGGGFGNVRGAQGIRGGGGRGGLRGAGQTRGAQFGNYRRRNQQIHGQASFTLANSAVNAKPFSLNGLNTPQASYAQSRFSFIAGGPLVVKHLMKDPNTQFFVTYFGTRSSSPQLFTETVPTQAERRGDFSGATQSLSAPATNVPVTLTYPGLAGNVIPSALLNPISLKLLNYYPLPNQTGNVNNYQFETTQASNTDNLGVRLQRNITRKDRLSLNVQFQNRSGAIAQWFGVSDKSNGYGLNSNVGWTRNLSAAAISNLQFRLNRNQSHTVPYFSQLADPGAAFGIPGTSNNPLDYGPPTLTFTNFATLSDSIATLTRNQAQAATESITLLKSTHSVTVGFGYTRADLSTLSDPNGRGTFSFTGLATSAVAPNGQPVQGTGYDLADFLLGYPQSSSIRYGDASNYFYQNQYVAYAQDEWKARPDLTLTLGVRYEFFTPMIQKFGREANLDVAPGFSAVSVVTPAIAGPYSGVFPNGLIDANAHNFSPRVALAWKVPWTKHSTVVRAGYGIYYNEQVYVTLGGQLAQQPPFAISNAVNTSAANVLTLDEGFLTTAPTDITNTFAVSRHYPTPYAGTWNCTVQHDFSQGFFVELGYTGTKGTNLEERILPNQGPPGNAAVRAKTYQVGNAVGFIYDEPVGNSIFNAFHVRGVRRFNRGISFNVYYQFAKSIDDVPALGGAGNTTVQDWQNISADRGLSSFDVRHELQSSFVWSSPVAGPGSGVAANSRVGRLLKDWQLSGSLTAQTGNPLTARFLGNTTQLAQTGGTGNDRAEATGAPINTGSGFFNRDAFTNPQNGAFGNAGRNTIPGPGLVSLNLAFARSFSFSERRRLEFRVESNNALNHVNYTNFFTVVNAVNYGLPSAAGAMRTVDAVARFRF